MKMRKAMVAVACAGLLVVGSVAATMAYLTSTPDPVTNTFTVGKVEITLDEADVKVDGTYESDATVRVASNVYDLFPGHTYIKDPVVHVGGESEDCWIFVKLENGLKNIIDSQNTIESQIENNKWKPVDGETGIYAYESTVKAGANIPVFGTFKIATTVTDLSGYEKAEIKVTAYAVQADGFSSAAAAWTAAKTELVA